MTFQSLPHKQTVMSQMSGFDSTTDPGEKLGCKRENFSHTHTSSIIAKATQKIPGEADGFFYKYYFFFKFASVKVLNS